MVILMVCCDNSRYSFGLQPVTCRLCSARFGLPTLCRPPPPRDSWWRAITRTTLTVMTLIHFTLFAGNFPHERVIVPFTASFYASRQLENGTNICQAYLEKRSGISRRWSSCYYFGADNDIWRRWASMTSDSDV